jgi:hypothetical protein
MKRLSAEFATGITLVYRKYDKEDWELLLGKNNLKFYFILKSRVAQADPNVSYTTLPNHEKPSTLIQTILINTETFFKNVKIR